MSKRATETEQFLLDLMFQPDIENAWSKLKDRMVSYGFDRVLYAATRFRTDHTTGDLRDAFILTNHPKEFTDPYLEGGLFRDAPMVRWAMQNVGTLSWGEIARDASEGRLPPEVMRVVEFNRKHGIVAGYGISFPRHSVRAGHGIGLGSTTMTQAEADAIWANSGHEIELICHVTHLTFLSLPYGLHGRNLTNRQREVLELIADGKTAQDIAVLLKKSPTTIEKHLRLARKELNVETTAQAILKISIQNQFFMYDP